MLFFIDQISSKAEMMHHIFVALVEKCREISELVEDKNMQKALEEYNKLFRNENNLYKQFTNYEDSTFRTSRDFAMDIPSDGTFFDKSKYSFEEKFYTNTIMELSEKYENLSLLYKRIIDSKIIEKIDNDKIILYQNLHFLESLKDQILSYEDILYENKEYINNSFNEFKQRIQRSDMTYTIEYFDNLFIEIKRVYDLSLVKLDEYCEKYLKGVNDYLEKKKEIDACSKKLSNLVVDVGKHNKDLRRAKANIELQNAELKLCLKDLKRIEVEIIAKDKEIQKGEKKKITEEQMMLLRIHREKLQHELAIIDQAVRFAQRKLDEDKAAYEAMPGFTGGYRKKYLKYKLKYLSLKESLI
jgi:hypothetical protein